MSAQSPLPGFDEPAVPTDLIFLAAVPDIAVVPAIQQVTQQMIEQHGLKGRPVIDGRLHISLIELGEHAGVSSPLLDAISRAAASVSQPAFDVVFDHFERYFSGACALSEGTRCDGFANLKQSLFAALKAEGVTRKKSPAPHMTLLYDKKPVVRQQVLSVAWKVREFVLLHRPLSEKGKPYNILARWPLPD